MSGTSIYSSAVERAREYADTLVRITSGLPEKTPVIEEAEVAYAGLQGLAFDDGSGEDFEKHYLRGKVAFQIYDRRINLPGFNVTPLPNGEFDMGSEERIELEKKRFQRAYGTQM